MTQTKTMWMGAQGARLVAAAVVGAAVLYGALVATGHADLPAQPAPPVRYQRTSVRVLEWDNKELQRLLETGYEVEDVHPNGAGILVYVLRKPAA